MVSLFGAGSFSAALIGGELADRLGRRPVMLLSFLLAPFNMSLSGWRNPCRCWPCSRLPRDCSPTCTARR